MKKIHFSFAVWVALVLPLAALGATETVDGIEWTYKVVGGTALIGSDNWSNQQAIPRSTIGAITIPSSLGGYPVRSIGAYAFLSCSGLTSVTIPDGLTEIGESAFYGCNGLTAVHIHDLAAWYGISFGNYSANPFYFARHLYLNGEEIEIAGDLVIPDGVTRIGGHAFYNCNSLTSVTIPNSVTNIGNSAFSGCNGLTAVHIYDLEAWCRISFGNYAAANPLYYARHLYLNGEEVAGDLTISDDVTCIKDFVFYNCSGLTNVKISDSVTSIGQEAFYGCSSLTNVMISASVTNIGYNAFARCSGLTSVLIPEGVTSIERSVFYGCSSLTNVTIPDAVTYIGNNAFAGCTSLTSVTIPASVTNIEWKAFSGCRNLTSVTILDNVTHLGSRAFENCSGLTSVTILGNIKDENDEWVYWEEYDYQDPFRHSSESPFAGCTNLSTLVLGGNLTSVGQCLFSDCTGLTSVTIGENVTSIGWFAFSGCSNLTNVTIPDNVTDVGVEAFKNCSGLTSVTIGESVASIHELAFSGCNNLQEIVFRGNIPGGLSDRSYLPFGSASCQVWFPEAYGAEWTRLLLPLHGTVMNYVREASCQIAVISAQMRETDPTILDVVYKVTSTNDTVNVRALAFEDGERSFAKVVRPETFVEGTGANLGDAIAANVEHTVSWRVSEDWGTDLAKVKFEILVSDEAQIPMELVSIPVAGTNAAMTINVRRPREEDLFNALLWHYANHADELTVVEGMLQCGETTLANGTSIANSSAACGYVYDKMGFDLLTGDALTYARSVTRWPLATTTGCQYGVLRVAGE